MLDQVEILFEDQDLLVITKPAGVVVNEADSVSVPTVQDWMGERVMEQSEIEWRSLVPADFAAEYGSPEAIFAERKGIVHRLDKDTSGVLVLAKNPGALVNLLSQFRNRQVKKQYLCLVHGGFSVSKGVVVAPLARARQDRKKFAVVIEGRKAETEYQVEKILPKMNWDRLRKLAKDKGLKLERRLVVLYQQGFSLVRCFPKTGRTHQIRVHMAHLRHPLVGDVVYGGRKRAKLDPLWCPRQFLHAEQIEFNHPRTGEKVKIKADLPVDLEETLNFLAEA